MPYILQQVPNNGEINVPERWWGNAGIIYFGAMTSCIAVIAQTPGGEPRVRGVHLSIFSNDGTPVYDGNSNVLGQMNNIMKDAVELRACLGRIDFWQGNESQEVRDFFTTLMQNLGILTWVQLSDGQLNVAVNVAENTIRYQHEGGEWQNVPYEESTWDMSAK